MHRLFHSDPTSVLIYRDIHRDNSERIGEYKIRRIKCYFKWTFKKKKTSTEKKKAFFPKILALICNVNQLTNIYSELVWEQYSQV